jgi:hypothetical protein
MAAWESRQQSEQLRGKAQQDALRRYPDLANRGSEFYTEVNSRLNELGDSYVKNNPRAVLDAANDVAAEMGMSPRTASKAANMRGRVGRKSNSNPNPKDTKKKSEMSDKDFASIGRQLGSALPKGKSFDKKFIKERAEFYRDNRQYYLRG